MTIKASTITNLTDARYFAAQEVDYLGFNLNEHTPNYLDPMYMKAMREWIQGPKITGEFGTMPLEHISEAAKFYELDAIQIPLSLLLKDMNTFTEVEVLAYLQLEVENIEKNLPALENIKNLVNYFVIDLHISPQTFQQITSKQAHNLQALFFNYPILVNLPLLPPAILLEFIIQYKPSGLSIYGGSEERVGVKSFDEVEEIFEGLNT